MMTERGDHRDIIDPDYIKEAARNLKSQHSDDKFVESEILYF